MRRAGDVCRLRVQQPRVNRSQLQHTAAADPSTEVADKGERIRTLEKEM
eukprot:COSAG02_NODE_9471_length_2206_cov_1.986711_3_plen_48_part_01